MSDDLLWALIEIEFEEAMSEFVEVWFAFAFVRLTGSPPPSPDW